MHRRRPEMMCTDLKLHAKIQEMRSASTEKEAIARPTKRRAVDHPTID